MLIVTNKRYVKKHIVGGAGLFDTISSFVKKLMSSNTARAIASVAATDLGKSAISAAKTVGKELAASGISVAKDVVIDKGKRLIKKAAPPEQDRVSKAKEIIASLVNGQETTTDINKLMMGQGPIRIEDLARQMNGAGLRLA